MSRTAATDRVVALAPRPVRVISPDPVNRHGFMAFARRRAELAPCDIVARANVSFAPTPGRAIELRGLVEAVT